MLKNSRDQYGSVSKIFHWVTALAVIGLLAVGIYMTDLENGPDKFKIYGLHKSFGITVLALTLCRVVWHRISKKPDAVATLKKAEKLIGKALYGLFYIALFIMPLSGWAMSSAKSFPVSFFGLFTLPNIVPADEGMSKIYKEVHEIAGYTLLVLVGLHAAAALKHHFIEKDAVLKRMLPALALLFLLSFPALAEEPSYAAQKWIVRQKESTISFSVKQMDAKCKGTFDRFTSYIFFDPDDLANSHARIEIDLVSVNTQAMDRDENLRSAEWFDIAHFPTARFETTAFHKTGDNTYEADANLTIRDVTLPIKLPFTLTMKNEGENKIIAVMDSSIVLDRSKFKLGEGKWSDASVIGNDVTVDIHVTAMADYNHLTLRPPAP